MGGDHGARFQGSTWLRLVTAGASLIGVTASTLSGQELGALAGTVITGERSAGGKRSSPGDRLGDDRPHRRRRPVSTHASDPWRADARGPDARVQQGARAVAIEPGLTRTVQVTLVTQAIALRPVEITEDWAMSPGLRGFHERRERGGGHFFTREQIERMHARLVTDILRRVPGVQIQAVPGPYETSYIIRMGRATGGMGSRPCPALFYVNGSPFPVKSDLAINQFVAPDDIEAVEVYTGTSRIPPEFSSNMHNSRCGVVAIWTRIGTYGRTPSQPSPTPAKP